MSAVQECVVSAERSSSVRRLTFRICVHTVVTWSLDRYNCCGDASDMAPGAGNSSLGDEVIHCSTAVLSHLPWLPTLLAQQGPEVQCTERGISQRSGFKGFKGQQCTSTHTAEELLNEV